MLLWSCTHFHGGCWCPDCLRWRCSPSGTEQHPQSRWQGMCRAYHTGHCRHCITYCIQKKQKGEVNETKGTRGNNKKNLSKNEQNLTWTFLPHPEILSPLPRSQAFQRIQANKFTAWYKVTSHTESLIFHGPSSELCFMREWLTVLTSETQQQWYDQQIYRSRELARKVWELTRRNRVECCIKISFLILG